MFNVVLSCNIDCKDLYQLSQNVAGGIHADGAQKTPIVFN